MRESATLFRRSAAGEDRGSRMKRESRKKGKTPQVVKLTGFPTDREGFEPSVRF